MGIPQLDAQHRKLIELVNAVRTCAQCGDPEGRVPAALEELHKYAQSHLEREELLLRVRAYPDYEEHKAEHDVYREKLAALLAKADRRDIMVRISNFLDEWWKYHILKSDQQYARYFRRQASGQ